jgi:mono/diheme cytochrome c family protein
MLKSILLVLGGSLAIAAPLATAVQAGRTPAQATTPAPTQTPVANGQATPAMGETQTAVPPAAIPAGAIAAGTKNPAKPTAESQAKAKQLYAIDCAMCHGDNGNGKTDLATSMSLTLSDFTDPKSLDGHPDGEIFNIIRNGKDKMPGEDKARASDTEVWNIVIYVRSFAKSQGAAPQAAESQAK